MFIDLNAKTLCTEIEGVLEKKFYVPTCIVTEREEITNVELVKRL
jgi:hypothetical protein